MAPILWFALAAHGWVLAGWNKDYPAGDHSH